MHCFSAGQLCLLIDVREECLSTEVPCCSCWQLNAIFFLLSHILAFSGSLDNKQKRRTAFRKMKNLSGFKVRLRNENKPHNTNHFINMIIKLVQYIALEHNSFNHLQT